LKCRKESALYEFGKAIAQDERHFSAWSNQIILLDELGRLEEAEISAEKAKIIFPEKAEFYFHLGNIFGKQGVFEKAETHYHHAIHILGQSHSYKYYKTQSLYRSNLGVLYHRWKRIKEAIQNYEDALSYDPNNENARNNLNILLKLHKLTKDHDTITLL
jgi:tetratricopeptide (TPR) repeat protein